MKINIIRKHWMNVLASVMLAGMFACSGNELEQVSNGYDPKEPGRAVDLITQTIETDTVGGLETALKAAMGEEVGTLQKLVIKGPISGDDWRFVRSLTELVEIDMTDTKIVGEGGFNCLYYNESRYYSIFKEDTICEYMFGQYATHGGTSEFRKLEKVILPPIVKHIGAYAFQDCNTLKTVEMPSSVTKIGYGAFYDCDALETIEIPSSVSEIGSHAFYECHALDSVKLNEGLTTIGQYAFYRSSLKSIEIPASLTTLGFYAFNACESLTSVSFLGDKLVGIGDYAFYGCSALTTVDLPEKLEWIGGRAFYECSALTSITLPDSLDAIYSEAFRYCSALTEITIPQNVKNLSGSSIFQNCTSLKSAKILANVTKLPNNFLDDCLALETVELASNITELGDYAFDWCNLSDDSPFTNIKILNYRCFGNCKFKTFDLSNMTNLGTNTFEGCEQLESVTFPEGITTIPSQFFDKCRAMTSITLPSTVTKIDYGAFANTGFATFEVPSTVTQIGSDAFSNSQIRELTIPETVTSVGNYFANNCENLIAVYWNSPIAVPYNSGTKTCFLYLANDQIAYNRDSWKNVIMGGVAESIVLNEDNVYNRRASRYTATKKFLAKKISYTRRFDDTTYPGRSSGWQTLTLPFTPTSITHASKGVVAPFNSEVEDAKPFWLRELTSEGFVDVTTIEPNKPYIVAMPNHGDYLDEYRLNGDITFSADSVYVEVTPDELTASIGPNFELHPSYAKTAKSAGVYSLNSDTYISGHDYGSVFVRSLDDVYTFEAYVTTLGGGRSSRSLFGTDTHSKATRAAGQRNTTGIPQIGDM